MAEVEDRQGRLAPLGVELAHLLHRLPHRLFFASQLHRLLPEGLLVHGAFEVGRQQPVLHGLQFRLPLRESGRLATLVRVNVGKGPFEGVAEQVRNFGRWQLESLQIVDDGLFQVVRLPTDLRVVRAGAVVGTAVVKVLAHAAVLQFAADTFARERLAAEGAAEQAAGKRVFGVAVSAILAVENVLARLKRRPINQRLMLTSIMLAPSFDLSDVEAVVEDVRESGAVESRLALAINVSFLGQLVRQAFEGVLAGCVQLEDTDHGLRFDRMRLDRFLAVTFDVHVAVAGQASRPTLPNALVHALEHFLSQVVAVVLSHSRHHVERECAGGTGPELVLDEAQPHTAGVFEFLQPHGVPHVAADSVQFVAQDRVDLFQLGVRFDPAEHLVEDLPLRSAPGRLVQFELPDDVPSLAPGLFAVRPQLRVDGVALSLLARRDAGPYDDVPRFAV